MYGVVVCSRCRRGMGADLRNRTARCQCGHQIQLKEAKKFFESSSQREVADAVARLNAELGGGTEEWEEIAGKSTTVEADDAFSEIAANASKAAESKDRLRIVVEGLTDALGGFTVNDLGKVLGKLGIKDVEDCISLLLRENMIYEPRKDFYRSV